MMKPTSSDHPTPHHPLGHETWQPPLYYVLAGMLAWISPDPKVIQLFSLITSVGTLFVARKLICTDTFLRTHESKVFAFLIVSLLPQFVMYTLQISNDSLSVFLGFYVFHVANRFVKQVTTKRFFTLIVVLSLGLLTKGQFLVLAAILFPLSSVHYFTQCKTISKQSTKMLLFMLIFTILALGCTKYIQNLTHYGKPFVSNHDFKPDWMEPSRGRAAFLDINLTKLIIDPTLTDATRFSIPLLLYGTFWYHCINDSNFRGDLHPWPKHIGRYLYLLGIVPAVVLVIGGFSILFKLKKVIGNESTPPSSVLRIASVAAFIGNFCILLWAFWLFDFCYMFQARYIFPTLIGSFVLFDLGLQSLTCQALVKKVFNFWQPAFVLGVASYFSCEIVLQLMNPS